MRVLLWLTGREQSRTARCVETWQYWRPLPRGVDWSPTAQLRAAIVHSAPHQWMGDAQRLFKAPLTSPSSQPSHTSIHTLTICQRGFLPKKRSRQSKGARSLWMSYVPNFPWCG